MTLLQDLPLERLTPARLWGAMDLETRRLAVRCLYDPAWDDASSRAEADAAIATALRFRHAAVRRLPVDRRVDYLCRAVRPDNSLATALLRALHVGARSGMLSDFLETLGIPQEGGVIDTDRELDPPERAALATAAGSLHASYPASDVDLYLATLLSMDPDFWAGLTDVVRPGA
jgi:hypothetical protein